MHYTDAVAEAEARVRVRVVPILILRLGGDALDDTAPEKTSAQFEEDEFKRDSFSPKRILPPGAACEGGLD